MSANAVGREQWRPIKAHGRADRRAKWLIFRMLVVPRWWPDARISREHSRPMRPLAADDASVAVSGPC
jgi:hypothetical protein